MSPGPGAAFPVLPDYSGATLANLLPGIAARLAGEQPVMDIPAAARYVVLLVDGLGWEQLVAHRDHSEFMSRLLPGASPITCGIPSTTATSLTSLGCGATPGDHGVIGYTFLDPDADRVLNALSWEGGPPDVEAFRRAGTVFQSLAAAGTRSAAVTLPRFADSALTRLAFQGTRQHGIELESDPEVVRAAVRRALDDSDVVYCYERTLDHSGHGFGVGSWQWLDALGHADDVVRALDADLPGDACLLVTGDHGMVNVPVAHRVVAEDHPELAGFRHIAGEGRLRQLHGPRPAALARAWAAFLGDRALVRLRDDAIDEGWFGPRLAPGVRERLGQVLVAMRGDWAVMSRTFPGEFDLVGMHGSLTAAEMRVPLLAIGPA